MIIKRHVLIFLSESLKCKERKITEEHLSNFKHNFEQADENTDSAALQLHWSNFSRTL